MGRGREGNRKREKMEMAKTEGTRKGREQESLCYAITP